MNTILGVPKYHNFPEMECNQTQENCMLKLKCNSYAQIYYTL